jgi:hypothetical protein
MSGTVSMGTAAALTRSMSGIRDHFEKALHTTEHKLQVMRDAFEEPSKHAEERIATIVKGLERRFPKPTVYLSNTSFTRGTYRIRSPGHYKITEDIVFDPPALEQPNRLYPFPPYQLGFFACIAVESEGVILDLGGHSISQSPRHALLQRFHALIELSSQPFDHNIGPSGFGNNNKSAHNCLVRNGYLGRSSHHGIHSSGSPTNVVIQDISMHDFEIAGVHLNGARNCHLQRLHVGPNFKQVPVMATFSQAIFALKAIQNMSADQTWRGKTPAGIAERLQFVVDKATNEVLATGKTTDPLFQNETGLVDGNVYGMVVHGSGVVVGNFKGETVPSTAGNQVTITEVCIEDLSSKPNTVKSVSLSTTDDEKYGAAGRVHTGPIGDVIDFGTIAGPNDQYVPNPLSEAQFLAAKWSKGTARCSDAILRWAEYGDGSLTRILDRYPFDCSRDAMDHVMKGTVGLFVSNVEVLAVVNAIVCDVENLGVDVSTCDSFRGNHLSGILLDATQNATVVNITVNNMNTLSGFVSGLETIGNTTLCTENVEVSRLAPAGQRCAMMRVAQESTVKVGPGHQPCMLRG